MTPVPRRLRRRTGASWVRAGAMHPITLVGPALVHRVRTRYGGMWDDLDGFPWPLAPTLRDATAATCQEELMPLGISTRHYYRLVDRVWRVVFGVPWTPTSKGGGT